MYERELTRELRDAPVCRERQPHNQLRLFVASYFLLTCANAKAKIYSLCATRSCTADCSVLVILLAVKQADGREVRAPLRPM